MPRIIAVEHYDTWTQVLNYLIDVNYWYSGKISEWYEEVYFVVELDVYKVVIKVPT